MCLWLLMLAPLKTIQEGRGVLAPLKTQQQDTDLSRASAMNDSRTKQHHQRSALANVIAKIASHVLFVILTWCLEAMSSEL